MISHLVRRAGAGAAVLATLLAVVPAPPAGAAADPVVKIDQPTDKQVLDSASPRISGTVRLLPKVTLTLTAAGKDPLVYPCSVQEDPNKPLDLRRAFSCAASIAANGPYTATVKGTAALGDTTISDSTSDPVTFAVAAPPKTPVLEAPKVTDGRTVELTWSRNEEPDMLYYTVFRKDPGSPEFSPAGVRAPQPATGSTESFTDTSTTANGGDYSYRVVATRIGSSGTSNTQVSSDPSAPSPASVPAPPATTVAPAPGGASASTARGGTTGPSTRPTVTEPDNGFKTNLPFAAVEPGDAQATPPGSRPSSVVSNLQSGRPLVPVAAGLVLLVLAMHVRLLARRTRPTDGDLPVELGVPAAPTAIIRPRPEPEPRPQPALVPEADAQPQFYDVMKVQGWDDPWRAGREPGRAEAEVSEVVSPPRRRLARSAGH